ncbi:MAG: ABC transporter ATP-binding protein [Rikenellaceae bacterium]
MTLTGSIKWLWRVSRGYRLSISINAMLGILAIGFSLLFIWLSKSLIDKAVAGDIHGGLTSDALKIVGVALAQQLFTLVRGRLDIQVSTKMINNMRKKLFLRVLQGKWHGKELFHTGDLTTRLNGDVSKVCDTLSIYIPQMTITLFEFLFSFLFMLSLDSRLAWLLFFIMPIALILSKSYILKVRSLTHSIREVDSSVQSHLQEQIQHRNVINSMGNAHGSLQFLHKLSDLLLAKVMHRTNYTLFSKGVVRLGFLAGYLIAFLWGVKGLSSGAVSFGVMTAFLQLVARVQNPIVELSSILSYMAQTTSSIERVEEIESLEIEQQGAAQLIPGSVGVKVSDLTFRYEPEGRNIMSHFDCDFLPNRLHVIVGETGSGKSTLLRIMLGFLSKNSGEVCLYNDSMEVECSPLTRANFVYVPQGNTLMSGTIRNNLLMADPNATDTMISEVLHVAVAEFVYNLPDGLDTICGERGAGLSEGEAQRIAIARGLLLKGGVLLLDEPTSALDSVTEKLLIERLTEYSKNRTLIMVTHREKSAQMCVNVVRLQRSN